MDSTPLRAVMPLQAALANAFCYLISSMDDPNVQVAQRATLYLGTVHDTAMQVGWSVDFIPTTVALVVLYGHLNLNNLLLWVDLVLPVYVTYNLNQLGVVDILHIQLHQLINFTG